MSSLLLRRVLVATLALLFAVLSVQPRGMGTAGLTDSRAPAPVLQGEADLDDDASRDLHPDSVKIAKLVPLTDLPDDTHEALCWAWSPGSQPRVKIHDDAFSRRGLVVNTHLRPPNA